MPCRRDRRVAPFTLGRVDDDGLEGNDRAGAVFAGDVSGHLDLLDHFNRAVGALGNRRRSRGQDCKELLMRKAPIGSLPPDSLASALIAT